MLITDGQITTVNNAPFSDLGARLLCSALPIAIIVALAVFVARPRSSPGVRRWAC